jgi:glucose/arabinose dehydrogenase
MTAPTAEGGALRSQDVRTAADPTTLDGAVLRLDPMTGAALADNPMASSTDPNRARIIAYGLRNPFRMTIRPGTSEVWLGDVGWGTWEEINRVVDPRDAVVENFGWPCYEGANTQGSYDGLNLNLCESLYAANTHTAPYYAYRHGSTVIPNEQCPVTRDPPWRGRRSGSTPGARIPPNTTARSSSPTTRAAASG